MVRVWVFRIFYKLSNPTFWKIALLKQAKDNLVINDVARVIFPNVLHYASCNTRHFEYRHSRSVAGFFKREVAELFFCVVEPTWLDQADVLHRLDIIPRSTFTASGSLRSSSSTITFLS